MSLAESFYKKEKWLTFLPNNPIVIRPFIGSSFSITEKGIIIYFV